ncbi:MAG: class I SAM-dependent methyltransferase [Terracidiphilus sp.]
MMRNERCPLCGSETDLVIQLRLNAKMNIPAEPGIRHCASDNFLFVANGCQTDYDEYYKSLANDSYHAELSGRSTRSPISELQRGRLVQALGEFFDRSRKVLDFGCGEASLLVELAIEFPASTFWGFDPGPAAQIGTKKAKALNLDNLSIADLETSTLYGPYDLVVASHVIEHLLDFDVLHLLNTLLGEGGLLYIEVPNALQYIEYERREFLYYFDRLHVNHFTPQSLTRLVAVHGFGYVRHFEYAFPYRDGNEYPALGMLFRKGREICGISSPSILDTARRYISQEKERAKAVAGQLNACEGVLVWGAGDNLHRSAENGGPLSNLQNMVVLDRRPQEISIGGRKYITQDPQEGIRRYSWPVVITVSEGRKSLGDLVRQIDPQRPVFFV